MESGTILASEVPSGKKKDAELTLPSIVAQKGGEVIFGDGKIFHPIRRERRTRVRGSYHRSNENP